MALALALLEPNDLGRFYEWRVDASTPLSVHEMTIRSAIEREGAKFNRKRHTTRVDWKKAIEAVTFKQFTLAEQTFSNLNDALAFVRDRVSIHSYGESGRAFTMQPPVTLFFTSFIQIGKDLLLGGHIAAIIGVAEPPMGSRTGLPPLLIVSSYAIGEDHVCVADVSDPQYFGRTAWIDDYTVKRLGASYVINWIERN